MKPRVFVVMMTTAVMKMIGSVCSAALTADKRLDEGGFAIFREQAPGRTAACEMTKGRTDRAHRTMISIIEKVSRDLPRMSSAPIAAKAQGPAAVQDVISATLVLKAGVFNRKKLLHAVREYGEQHGLAIKIQKRRRLWNPAMTIYLAGSRKAIFDLWREFSGRVRSADIAVASSGPDDYPNAASSEMVVSYTANVNQTGENPFLSFDDYISSRSYRSLTLRWPTNYG